MPKFEDVRKLQKMVWELAEKATHRHPSPTERATATKLISEAYDDPSPARVAQLKRWISTPFTETAIVRAPIVEGATLTGGSLVMEEAPPAASSAQTTVALKAAAALVETGRQLLGRDLTEAETKDLADTILQRSRTGVTEAELAKLSHGDFLQKLGESSLASSLASSNRLARTARVSESAAVVPGPSLEALAAEMNALPVHSVERREAWESLREAYARAQPFGGRRLDEA